MAISIDEEQQQQLLQQLQLIHREFLGLTYPLSHRRYITVGLIEERHYEVCLSFTNGGSGARPHRVVFDFTDWNLLMFLQERITEDSLRHRSSDVKLVLFEDKEKEEEERIKSVLDVYKRQVQRARK